MMSAFKSDIATSYFAKYSSLVPQSPIQGIEANVEKFEQCREIFPFRAAQGRGQNEKWEGPKYFFDWRDKDIVTFRTWGQCRIVRRRVVVTYLHGVFRSLHCLELTSERLWRHHIWFVSDCHNAFIFFSQAPKTSRSSRWTPWTNWIGAWTSWRKFKRTDPSARWLPIRYARFMLRTCYAVWERGINGLIITWGKQRRRSLSLLEDKVFPADTSTTPSPCRDYAEKILSGHMS